MSQQKELRILQYNVHKSRNKVMIALLHEEKIKDYDILVLQEPWRFDDISRAYCPATAGFTLEDNGGRTCFYINKRIDSNTWHSTWHSKDVGTITLQTLTGDAQMTQEAIHIHGAYNPPPRDHGVIHEKGNLPDIEKALHMSGESILVGDFNLHHSTWGGPSYPRQHLLSNELIKMTTNIGASLALPRGTITRDYQGSQTTIDLVFTTDGIMNRLIRCGIDEEMENSSDHLPIQTIIDLRACEEPARKPRRNWKAMDEEKFINTLREQMPEPLSDHEAGRRRIDEYTKQLLDALEEAVEISTPWARPHEMAKAGWTKECTEVVKSVRRMRRSCRTVGDWAEYIRACDKKGKIIRKQKRSEYREAMQNVEQSSRGLFRTAKWARNAAAGTLTQATIPPLAKPGCSDTATTAQDKAEVMFQAHFPPPPEVPMLDTIGFEYPPSVEDGAPLTHREIKRAAYKAAPDKAPGHTGYTNRIMRRLVDGAPEQIRSLFERCLQEGIQPTQFKSAATIVMRKPGKKDYSNAKAYRPIALLDTLGKILEFIVSERLRNAVEACGSIPDTQMGARKHRSTDTTLQLITEKIHTVWSGTRRRVASLLSLDGEGAFDNVAHSRLLHDMKKRKVPRLLLGFVKDFLRDRRTTITIGGYTTTERSVNIGIPQGSPLSPILYLFYNADLLEACDDIKLRTSSTGFVNDVNILTYGESTKRNCRVLSEIYDRCEQWSKTHGTKFSMTKHELIHFTRTSKWFNMKVGVELAGHQVDSKSDIRVLGVQLDSKLRWAAHMHHVEAKLVIRQKAMQTITGSTWGPSVAAGRQIYSAVARPLLSHGAAIWYMPQGVKGHRKGLNAKLRSVQGRALRQITGAYRATSTEALQVETNTAPIDIHLRKLVQRSITNMDSRKSGEVVEAAVRRIRNDLTPKRGRKPKLRKTPLQLKRKWMEGTLGQTKMNRSHPYTATPWSEPPKVVIAANKKMSIRQHNLDTSAPKQRVYSDGSGSRGDVTAAAVGMNWELGKRLGGPTLAITHHGELEGLVAGAEHLAGVAAADQECHGKIYKVYSDSQASLKTVEAMISTKDQTRLQRVQAAHESIRSRGATLELHWVAGHAGVLGNEAADKVADDAHDLPLPLAERQRTEVAARLALIQEQARQTWRVAWKEGSNAAHFRYLAPEVTHRHLRLHKGRAKPHSALLTQLRTGKIGFNQFLHERRVPGVDTAACECGRGRMSVKHVLLTCPKWKAERKAMQHGENTTDLRKLLGTRSAATAAIRMVLSISILNQFQAVASPESQMEERGSREGTSP